MDCCNYAQQPYAPRPGHHFYGCQQSLMHAPAGHLQQQQELLPPQQHHHHHQQQQMMQQSQYNCYEAAGAYAPYAAPPIETNGATRYNCRLPPAYPTGTCATSGSGCLSPRARAWLLIDAHFLRLASIPPSRCFLSFSSFFFLFLRFDSPASAGLLYFFFCSRSLSSSRATETRSSRAKTSQYRTDEVRNVGVLSFFPFFFFVSFFERMEETGIREALGVRSRRARCLSRRLRV